MIDVPAGHMDVPWCHIHHRDHGPGPWPGRPAGRMGPEGPAGRVRERFPWSGSV